MTIRLQLLDDAKTGKLLAKLGVDSRDLRFSVDRAPRQRVSIIHRVRDRNVVTQALWWLLVDPATGKANERYATFTSRWDKLDQPRSVAYRPYRESRCLIPVSAVIEGKGDRRTYHRIEREDEALALGGLHRETRLEASGETVHSMSVITVPAPANWRTISGDSAPLVLPIDDTALINRWLAPSYHHVETFAGLLAGGMPFSLTATPIGKPGRWDAVGESFTLDVG